LSSVLAGSLAVVFSLAFGIVFGLFVVALLALCAWIITWAIRRDRSRWREWQHHRRDGAG
jgi:O-antigen/teichoic acid export membrane protein